MKNQIAAPEKIIGFFLLAVMLCLSACGAPAEKEDARQPEAEEPLDGARGLGEGGEVFRRE